VKPFFVAALLLFAMAMSVDDDQDENDEAPDHQQDEYGTIPPDFGHQGPKICISISIHPLPIYIRTAENQSWKRGLRRRIPRTTVTNLAIKMANGKPCRLATVRRP
jgi:hypothetical protein